MKEELKGLVKVELDEILQDIDVPPHTFEVLAPLGNLGLVLDEPPGGGRVYVRKLSGRSPLRGQVQLGDEIIAIDGKDVRHLGSVVVGHLLGQNSDKAHRTISIAREGQAPAGHEYVAAMLEEEGNVIRMEGGAIIVSSERSAVEVGHPEDSRRQPFDSANPPAENSARDWNSMTTDQIRQEAQCLLRQATGSGSDPNSETGSMSGYSSNGSQPTSESGSGSGYSSIESEPSNKTKSSDETEPCSDAPSDLDDVPQTFGDRIRHDTLMQGRNSTNTVQSRTGRERRKPPAKEESGGILQDMEIPRGTNGDRIRRKAQVLLRDMDVGEKEESSGDWAVF